MKTAAGLFFISVMLMAMMLVYTATSLVPQHRVIAVQMDAALIAAEEAEQR